MGRTSMNGILVQLVLLIAIAHGFPALRHLAGPRRCGLVLGLPSTTVILLLSCVQERGVGGAMEVAEASLLGLVAAASLPLAYAHATRAVARLPWTPAAAVVGYVAVAAVFGSLPDIGAAGRAVLSLIGVLTACRWAECVRISGGAPGPVTGSWGRTLALRTAIPAILLVTLKAIRGVADPSWEGLFLAFPAMSLAVLVATHLETGPGGACQVARSLPTGNLSMVAFLAAFRFIGPRLGPGWGMAGGYAASLSVLLVLEVSARSAATGPAARSRSPYRIHEARMRGPLLAGGTRRTMTFLSDEPRSPLGRRPRRRVGFAPGLELISG